MKKRILSLLVALCMIVGLVPAALMTASADRVSATATITTYNPTADAVETITLSIDPETSADYAATDANGYATEAAGELTDNYVKLAYDANDVPTIYLKNAKLNGVGKNTTNGVITLGGRVTAIVVEADSSITADNVAISVSTAGATISGSGNLTVTNTTTSGSYGAIMASGPLTFAAGANVEVTAEDGYCFRISNALVTVNGGTLNFVSKTADRVFMLAGTASLAFNDGNVEISHAGTSATEYAVNVGTGTVTFTGGTVKITTGGRVTNKIGAFTFPADTVVAGTSEANATAQNTTLASGVAYKYFYFNKPVITPEASTPGTQAPTTGTQAPTTGTQAPTTGSEAPTTGTQAPTTGTQAPTTGSEAPTTGTQAPTTGTQAPTTGTEASAPTTGTQAPTQAPEETVPVPTLPADQATTPAEPADQPTQPVEKKDATVTLNAGSKLVLSISASNPVAYAKTDAQGNAIAGGSESDYQIKLAYAADGTPVLYLKNATLKGAGVAGSSGSGVITLTNTVKAIAVEADSTITANVIAIYAGAGATISGPAKLTITYTDTTTTNAAIVTYDALIFNSGANVEITAKDGTCIRSNYNSKITVNGGTLKLVTETSDRVIMLAGAGALEINNGDVELQHGGGSNNAIQVGTGSVTINGGLVKITTSGSGRVTNTVSAFVFPEGTTVAGTSEANAVAQTTTLASGKAYTYFFFSKLINEFTVAPSIQGWQAGQTASTPKAEAKYGTAVFYYAAANGGTYTTTVPTEAGVYYMKAVVAAGTKEINGAELAYEQLNSEAVRFVITAAGEPSVPGTEATTPSTPGATTPATPDATTPGATTPEATTPATPVPPTGDTFNPMVIVLVLASVAALAVLTLNRKKFI